MVRTAIGVALALAFFVSSPMARAAAPLADPRLGERVLGDPKAPVRIDEYASLDCPYCAAFDTKMLPVLKTEYIDKGKVKIVFHDYPLSQIALQAFMLVRCSPADRFFPMVDTLFHVQNGWVLSSQSASLDALKQQARFAGMKDAEIDGCLSDRALGDAILQGRLEAEKAIEIEQTPTFIFNGDKDDRFDGLAPYDVFKEKLDALTKNK
jgi:protein-disulfide isomerase